MHLLLTNGADMKVKSFSDESSADLTTSPAVVNLLSSNMKTDARAPANGRDLPIIPHYLSHPTITHPSDDHESPSKAARYQFSSSDADFYKKKNGLQT